MYLRSCREVFAIRSRSATRTSACSSAGTCCCVPLEHGSNVAALRDDTGRYWTILAGRTCCSTTAPHILLEPPPAAAVAAERRVLLLRCGQLTAAALATRHRGASRLLTTEISTQHARCAGTPEGWRLLVKPYTLQYTGAPPAPPNIWAFQVQGWSADGALGARSPPPSSSSSSNIAVSHSGSCAASPALVGCSRRHP